VIFVRIKCFVIYVLIICIVIFVRIKCFVIDGAASTASTSAWRSRSVVIHLHLPVRGIELLVGNETAQDK